MQTSTIVNMAKQLIATPVSAKITYNPVYSPNLKAEDLPKGYLKAGDKISYKDALTMVIANVQNPTLPSLFKLQKHLESQGMISEAKMLGEKLFEKTEDHWEHTHFFQKQEMKKMQSKQRAA